LLRAGAGPQCLPHERSGITKFGCEVALTALFVLWTAARSLSVGTKTRIGECAALRFCTSVCPNKLVSACPLLALKRPSIGRADRRLAGVKLALPNGRRIAAVDPSKARGRCGRSPSTPIRPSPFLRWSSALRRDHFVMPGRDALHPIAGTDMLDAQRRRTGPYWRVRPGMWQMGYSVNNNARFWRGDGLPEREQ
jgi:hypothetical protein